MMEITFDHKNRRAQDYMHTPSSSIFLLCNYSFKWIVRSALGACGKPMMVKPSKFNLVSIRNWNMNWPTTMVVSISRSRPNQWRFGAHSEEFHRPSKSSTVQVSMMVLDENRQ